MTLADNGDLELDSGDDESWNDEVSSWGSSSEEEKETFSEDVDDDSEDSDDEDSGWGSSEDDEDEDDSWGSDDEDDEEDPSSSESANLSVTSPNEVDDEVDDTPVPWTKEDSAAWDDGDGRQLSVADTGDADRTLTETINLDSSAFTLKPQSISTHSIAVSAPAKSYRKESYIGLSETVKQLGVLTPIHVTPTLSYLDWLETHDPDRDPYPDDKYLLLHGYRRLFAALRNKLDTIPAVIVTFRDVDYGAEIASAFSMVLGKSERHTWIEIWESMQVLESQFSVSPTTLEYLLQLEGGDSMKLRDVMTCEYPEVLEELLDKKKPLDMVYSKLNKLRKEEDRLGREDGQAIGDIDEARDLTGDSTGGQQQLSNSEVESILEMDTSLDDDSFGEASILGDAAAEVQNVKDRHPLDPAMRSRILRRDEFTCQVCNYGKGLTSSIQLGALEVHHMIPVLLGGPDSEDNLITLCSTCHKSAHIVANADGKIGMDAQAFSAMPEDGQREWTKLGNLAKIILNAEKRTGKKFKKEEVRKLPPNKPFWEVQKENLDAITTDYSHRDK